MSAEKGQKQTLRREEWDFSSYDDPLDGDACLRYELAREIHDPYSYFQVVDDSTRNSFSVAEWKMREDLEAPVPSDVQEHAGELMYRTQLDGRDLAEVKLREMFPGVYFKHAGDGVRAFPAHLSTPWLDLGRNWRDQLVGCFYQCTTAYRSLSEEAIARSEASLPGIKKKMSSPGPRQFFNVVVDWTQSDAAIREDFDLWLLLKRPKAYPAKQATGRQSPKDGLNALAAMRLRHQYRTDEVAQVTRAAMGRPLYADPHALDRAAGRAVELFKATYPGAGEPRSGTRKSNLRGRPPK